MNKHEIDLVSLLFGVAFLVVAGSWLLAKTIDFDGPAFGWIVAGSLVLLGLLGIFSALRPHRRTS